MIAEKSKRYIACLAVFYVTLFQISADVYLPSFPAMQRQLHTTSGAIQLTLSVFLLAFAISQLIYGPLGDRFGRRPVMITGMGLFFVASIGCWWAPTIHLLLIARFFQGFGAGVASVVTRSMLRDTFSGKALHRVASLQSVVWAFVPVVAPVLGSYLQHYFSWHANFVLLIFVSGAAFMTAVFFHPESVREKLPSLHIVVVLRNYWSVLTERQFYGNLLCGASDISSNMVFNVVAPFILQIYFGLSLLVYGWTILLIASSNIVGAWANRILLNYFSAKQLIYIGIILFGVSSTVLLIDSVMFNPRLWLFLTTIFLTQVGTGLVYPNVSSHAMQPFAQRAGFAAAIWGSLVFFMGSGFTFLLSHTHSQDALPLAAIFEALFVLMVFGLLLAKSRKT